MVGSFCAVSVSSGAACSSADLRCRPATAGRRTGRLSERPMGADCKSVGVCLRRFESFTCHRAPPHERGSGAQVRLATPRGHWPARTHCHGHEAAAPRRKRRPGSAPVGSPSRSATTPFTTTSRTPTESWWGSANVARSATRVRVEDDQVGGVPGLEHTAVGEAEGGRGQRRHPPDGLRQGQDAELAGVVAEDARERAVGAGMGGGVEAAAHRGDRTRRRSRRRPTAPRAARRRLSSLIDVERREHRGPFRGDDVEGGVHGVLAAVGGDLGQGVALPARVVGMA